MNKEVSSKINVTDQDINDYFAAHKSEFNLIEPQYHLAQIIRDAQRRIRKCTTRTIRRRTKPTLARKFR